MIIKYIMTLVFIITIKPTGCSIALDVLNQESALLSQYCPKQKYCREGTHVVCMYYDHNHVFGPHCVDPVDVEVTHKIEQSILANVNDIRGIVATGKERGRDGEVLPRAYGLMKLEWDKELAFLAQVLANQCLGGRGDFCRATEKFPNPSQTIAVVRYKYPDWEYVKSNNSEKGLNEDKLIFAVNKFFKSSHALKRTVTKDIIVHCPPFKELPDLNLRFYLNLIRGGATHIGCGISAYSKHKMNSDGESMQNNVQIVCNISDSPKAKQSVYNIGPPIPELGYTKRCGCPRGYKETRSCLCERDSSFHWKGYQIKNQLEADFKQDSNTDIKSHLEDQYNDDALTVMEPSSEMKDEQINGIESPHAHSKSRNIGNITEEIHPDLKHGGYIESNDKFSKIASAITPENKHIDSKFTQKADGPVKKSSKSQKSKPLHKSAPAANIFEDLIFNLQSYKETDATTESTLDVEEENLVGNIKDQTVDLKEQNEDAHKRLLSILDSLEQEVRNLKFDDDLKELFDTKMRKIYENGVNRGQTSLKTIPLDKKHNIKKLHERKTYLETETNKSIEDEIDSLRRMIQRWSKGKEKKHKISPAENENDPNQNHNYVGQQLDAYHNVAKSYGDIPRKATFEHRDYQNIFNDILNGKHNINRQHGHIPNFQENFESKDEETLANNNARQTILSKAISYNLDNYDQDKIVLDQSDINRIIKLRQHFERMNKKNIDSEGRHLDKNKNVNARRSSSISNKRQQMNHRYSRKNKKGEMHQILVRRPSQMDRLRLSINQPRQSMYSNERENFMF